MTSSTLHTVLLSLERPRVKSTEIHIYGEELTEGFLQLVTRSRIQERPILLSLGIILRVLRLEVSVYNVYCLLLIARRKTLKTFVPITSTTSASYCKIQNQRQTAQFSQAQQRHTKEESNDNAQRKKEGQ